MRARSTRPTLAAWLCALLAGGLLVATTQTAAAAPPFGAVISAQQMELLAGDAAVDDEFGYSVAISGDTAVVGAPFEDGAGSSRGSAYVYTRNGTAWTQQQQLFAATPSDDDRFGESVAVAGNTVVVGAPGDDDSAVGADQGTVTIFTRTGNTWTQQLHLVSDSAGGGDEFGFSVAISGDTLVVGAVGDDTPLGQDHGSASVYTRSGTTWTFQQKLDPNDGFAFDGFGYDVAIDGDTAVVGAPGDEGGRAYVFTRVVTEWTQQGKFSSEQAAADALFGTSVAVSGDTALIGAPFDNGQEGSAYVFGRTGTDWSPLQKLTHHVDPAGTDEFGHSVAISGDTALVGAYLDDPGGVNRGSAGVFSRSGTTWTRQHALTAGDGVDGDRFGFAVDISGDTALVGASLANAPATNQGSAYVFVPGSFSVSDITVTEGTGGTTDATFTVTRSGTAAHQAYINANTISGTATSGSDFTPQSTTLSFSPGVSSRTVTVPVMADALDEQDETFDVVLSSPVGALLGDAAGTGTITDDDAPSTLSITSPATSPATETDVGQVPVTFTVSRSGSTGGPVSVEVHTSDGTARAADDDYTPTAKTLRWADGETGVKGFTVMIEPDNITEPTERFFARLSRAVGADIVTGYARAIINDDDAPTVSIAVNNPTITEADSGTKNIVFKITRTGSTASAITFNYATANGVGAAGAVAPGDYTAKTGTATIASGATFVNVPVVTKGDTTPENTETFTLTISNPTGGATIGNAIGTGTLTNED